MTDTLTLYSRKPAINVKNQVGDYKADDVGNGNLSRDSLINHDFEKAGFDQKQVLKNRRLSLITHIL